MVDEGVDRPWCVEGPPARREQRIPDLAADHVLSQRRRQRAPGAPEAHAQWCVWFRLEAIALIGWLWRRRPVPGRARLLDRREDRDEMREPADRKDLMHHCVETSHAEPPVLRFPARGDHQSLQSAARNIFDSGKVDDDILGVGTDGGEQPPPKLGARAVVDPPYRSQDQEARLAPLPDLQPSLHRIGKADVLTNTILTEGAHGLGPCICARRFRAARMVRSATLLVG